jgi:hypothetical protein
MTRHANVVRIWVRWHLWYKTGWNDSSCTCCPHMSKMASPFAWRIISHSYISEMPFYSYAENMCMTSHFTQFYIRDAILLICEQHLHDVSFHPAIYQRCHFTHMRRNFFKCAPPNLKSWIRPWLWISCDYHWRNKMETNYHTDLTAPPPLNPPLIIIQQLLCLKISGVFSSFAVIFLDIKNLITKKCRNSGSRYT